MMNQFTTTARVTFDALDVPVGYCVSVTEARQLIETGLKVLSDLKEKHKEAMLSYAEKQRQKIEEYYSKKEKLHARRDEIYKEISKLEGYGTRWFSDEYREQQKIDDLHRESSSILTKLSENNRGYRCYYGPMTAGHCGEMDTMKLNELKNLLDIVAVDTIPVDKDQATMLSQIKSGEFQRRHARDYQQDYPVAETS